MPPTRLADARHAPHRGACHRTAQRADLLAGGGRSAFVARLCAIIAFTVCFIAFASAALAQTSLTFPELTGRVVDQASILDAATRAKLEKLSADLEAKSTDQLVVVTLNSLQGTSIEDYGYQLGRKWQIGQKDKNNGVLLIVAPSDRKVRIEVGYGLEGTLTDALSSFIIQQAILPRFRAGDIPGGVTRGAEDIVNVLTGDAEEYKERARAAHAAPGLSLGEMIVIAFWLLVAIMIIRNVIADMRRTSGAVPRGRVRRTRDWTDYNPIVIGGSSGSSSGGSWGGGGGGGGFSGGGGSFGGGGSSGSW